jgi:hypothetical protein
MNVYTGVTTEWDERLSVGGSRGRRKALAPPGKHIPNKNEASLLRRLMSESGMDEKQVRAVKENRVKLASARRAGTVAKRSRYAKALDSIMKGVTRQLKLAKEHPLVVAEYKKRLEEAKQKGRYLSYHLW